MLLLPHSQLRPSLALALATAMAALPACRLGANNSEKLIALKSGEVYDEDGILSVEISSPASSTLINLTSNSSNYAVSGTCSPDGVVISLSIDGSLLGETALCSGGAWNSSFDSTGLADGEHTLSAMTSRNGKEKSSQSVSFSKNTQLPSLAITSPANGSFINSTTDSTSFALAGTCSEAGQSVDVFVDDAAASAQNGGSCNGVTWAATFNTLGLPAGNHALKVSMTSASGNLKASEPITVLKDITAPTASISAPAASSYVNLGNNSASFAVSGACNDSSASVQVKVDGTNSGTAASCSGTAWNTSISTVGLAQGVHTLSAQITDAAGNSASSAAVSVTKDTSAPTVAIGSPAANSFLNIGNNSTSFAVSGTCSGATDNGRGVTIQINGTNATQSAIACGAGSTWSGTIDTTGLSDGGKTLSAILSDAAGNSTTSSPVAVTRDTVAPTLAISSPTGGATIQAQNNSTSFAVAGTCNEASQSVTVKVNGANASGQTGGSCSSGSWSATIDTTGLSDSASYTLSATLPDSAGNTGITASSTTLTKDLGKPGAPTFTRASAALDPYAGSQAASGAARYVNVSNATGILVEEATTNLFTEDFETAPAAVQTDSTLTSNTLTTEAALFGSKSLKLSSAASNFNFYRNGGAYTATSAATFTFTAYLKRADGAAPTIGLVYIRGSVSGYNSDYPTPRITAVGNGWYRITASKTFPSSQLVDLVGFQMSGSANVVHYTDGWQVEAKSYPTSYAGASATRAAETLILPNAGNIRASEGAIIIRAYVDGDNAATTVLNNHNLFDTGVSAGTNRLLIAQGTGSPGWWRAILYDSGSWSGSVAQWQQTLSVGWHIFGMRWNSSRLSIWVDGQERGFTTTVSLPSTLPTNAYVASNLGGGEQYNQALDYIAFYQHAPSNTQMDTFTSTGPTGYDNRLDFNGASFTRATTAYAIENANQITSGKERYSTQSGATGIVIEEGTTNLMPTNSDQFSSASGWLTYQGSSVTITAAQSDPFGGTAAYRVVTSGGTSYEKYFIGTSASTNGTPYSQGIWVKNNSATTFYARFWPGSIVRTVTQAEGWKFVKTENNIGDGSSLQMSLGTQTAGESFDVMLYRPQREAKNYLTSYTAPSATRNAENLSLPHANLLSATQGAVRARVMLLRTPGTNEQFVFDAGDTSATGLTGSIFTNGKAYIQAGNGSTLNSCYSTTVFAANTWYTLEFRWSATTLTMSVNGNPECNLTTFSNAVALNADGKIHIGSHRSSLRYFDGIIDWMEIEKSDGSSSRLDFSNSLGQ